MRRSTLEEFAAEPIGRYFAGETFVHFCASSRLWGVILWGRADVHHAQQLGRSLVLELGPAIPPHCSLVDVSRIEGGDPRAFGLAGRYITHHRTTLETQVERMALVRPGGIDGALVAGAYDILPRPYPVRLFLDVASAFAWIDPQADAVAGAAMLSAMYAEASSTPKDVGALRALLDSRLDGMPIAKAARELGLSGRTLQRKLGEAGTTYKDELADARVRAAKRLLLETSAPLTTIAFEVGCSSLQMFSALFRRRTNESPSAFRARHAKRS